MRLLRLVSSVLGAGGSTASAPPAAPTGAHGSPPGAPLRVIPPQAADDVAERELPNVVATSFPAQAARAALLDASIARAEERERLARRA